MNSSTNFTVSTFETSYSSTLENSPSINECSDLIHLLSGSKFAFGWNGGHRAHEFHAALLEPAVELILRGNDDGLAVRVQFGGRPDGPSRTTGDIRAIATCTVW